MNLLNHPLQNNKVFLKNASIAYEVCKDFMSIDDKQDFSTIIEDFTLQKGRGQVYNLSTNSFLIDDTYNANRATSLLYYSNTIPILYLCYTDSNTDPNTNTDTYTGVC